MQSPDQTVLCGNGTARYDAASKKLILENAVIDNDINGNPLIYGIEIQEEGITVELAGENTINAHYGIGSSYPFCLNGTSGSRLTFYMNQDQSLLGNSCRGIYIREGGLTIQNANLQFIIGNIGDANAYAIDVWDKDNLISNSHIEISTQSGSPTLYPESKGINMVGTASLTITDNSDIYIKNIDTGIGSTGNVTVSSSRLTIENIEQSAVSGGNIEILNGSELNLNSKYSPSLSGATITVSNSKVNTASEMNNGLACVNLEIKESSELTAKGYWPAVFVENSAVIKDSSVETESTDDVGIYCQDTVEIVNSQVKAADSILANGNISITGGMTEIGEGNISSRGGIINVKGIITSNGIPSYDNINGNVVFSDADYSAVDSAIAKAEALNKADYENFEEVEKAINAVVRGKDIREQHVVDGYATAIEAAIAALKPVSSNQNVYKIIEGADQTIIIGKNKDIIIKADGEFNKFLNVSMDGKEIEKENYTAASGSTIITLKSEYVSSLSEGDHTVTIHYTDGQAQTKLTVKNAEDSEKEESQSPTKNEENKESTSPETGDKLPIGWIAAFVFSAVICLTVRKYRMNVYN